MWVDRIVRIESLENSELTTVKRPQTSIDSKAVQESVRVVYRQAVCSSSALEFAAAGGARGRAGALAQRPTGTPSRHSVGSRAGLPSTRESERVLTQASWYEYHPSTPSGSKQGRGDEGIFIPTRLVLTGTRLSRPGSRPRASEPCGRVRADKETYKYS